MVSETIRPRTVFYKKIEHSLSAEQIFEKSFGSAIGLVQANILLPHSYPTACVLEAFQ
jgi:hypothetical protein